MMALDCDSPEVERALARLRDLLLLHGAWFHPDGRVVARGGDFTVVCESEASGGRLMQIPQCCLPLLDRHDLRAEGDALRLVGSDRAAGEVQTRCLQAVVDLFNVSGKLARHRECMPWFALASAPELVHALAEGRRGAHSVDRYRALFEAGDVDTLLRDTFFGSRKLDFAGTRPGCQAPVQMPFIDLLNHHGQAGTFYRVEEAGRETALAVDVAQPVAGSSECFVRYSPVDALDSYLAYGFVDDSAPHLRSVPVSLDVGGGTRIDAGARVARAFQGDLPPALRDLRPFVPEMQRRGARLAVSHLLVPGPRAPRALRRVLELLIRALRPDPGAAAMREAVLAAEAEVIDANARFYDRLQQLAVAADTDAPTTAAAKDRVRAIAAAQIRKLRAYEARLVECGDAAGAVRRAADTA